MRAIFDGADAQVRAAGAILAGGHTIRDAEPKYGLAVVGTVSPDGIWPKSGARAGDALYLTKPLGTALVLGGAKRGLADVATAVRWMRTLNRDAADVLRKLSPSAVTDVTGFGLLGHAHEMASRSGVRLVVDAERLPALDGALDAARAGVSTAGTRNNRSYGDVEVGDVAPELVELAYDPQTAGGLLVSLPRERGPALEAEFAAAGAVPGPDRQRGGGGGDRAEIGPASEAQRLGLQRLGLQCGRGRQRADARPSARARDLRAHGQGAHDRERGHARADRRLRARPSG